MSFDNSKSAAEAIEEMNGFEIRGKRLKVELNKKDEKAINADSLSLNQVNYEVWHWLTIHIISIIGADIIVKILFICAVIVNDSAVIINYCLMSCSTPISKLVYSSGKKNEPNSTPKFTIREEVESRAQRLRKFMIDFK